MNWLSGLMPQSINQTDRIQGMSRWMNDAGSSTEVMSLLMFVAFIVATVMALKLVAANNERKREAALKKKLAAKKKAQAQQPTRRPVRRATATRLR